MKDISKSTENEGESYNLTSVLCCEVPEGEVFVHSEKYT